MAQIPRSVGQLIDPNATTGARSKAAARLALGLGSAATHDHADYAAAGSGGAATTDASLLTSGTLDPALLPGVSGVAGSYTAANLTVDAKGRVTAASNGTGGGGSGASLSVANTFTQPQTLPLVDKGGQAWNVRAAGFNATGDGTTDDSAAFRTALAACAAAGGGEVFVPPGTYAVSHNLATYSGLRLPGKVTLRGAGIGASVIKVRGTTMDDGTTPLTGSSLITAYNLADDETAVIRGLTLLGPYAKHGDYNDPTVDGISSEDSAGATKGTLICEDMQIKGFVFGYHQNATAEDSTDTVIFRNCDIQSYTGILHPRKGRLLIDGCRIHGCGINKVGGVASGGNLNKHHDIYCYPGTSFHCANTHFSDYAPTGKGYACQIFGQGVTTTSEYTRFLGCTVDSTHYSGFLTHTSQPTIVANCSLSGRDVNTGPLLIYGDAIVTGCDFYGVCKGIVSFSSPDFPSNLVARDCTFRITGQPIACTNALTGSRWTIESCRFPNDTLTQAIATAAGVSTFCSRNTYSDSAGPGCSTTAARPDAARSGAGSDLFDTTLGSKVYSNGSAWVAY